MNTRHWPLYVGVALLVWLAPVSSLRAQEQKAAAETLPEIIKRIQPSTVVVLTYDAKGEPIGQGSGFFVSQAGHIITNRHVLEGASRAEIKTTQGKIHAIRHIVAEDKEGDLVRASVDIPAGSVQPLKLSDSIPLVGQRIVVIGTPLGFEGTVSDGIVSAVRNIPTFGKIIQLSAPISPGSSGSPVVNVQGQVIGIASLIVSEGQNLNFAIPAQRISRLKPGKPITLAEWQNRQINRYPSLSRRSGDKWRSYELDGKSTIWFPAQWKCTLQNSVPEKEYMDEEEMYFCTQELIDMELDLWPNDAMFISVVRTFLVNPNTGRQQLIIEEAMDEIEEAVAEGIQELPNAKIRSLPKSTMAGTKKVISRKYTFMSSPLEIPCTTYTFRAKNNIYTVFASYPEADIGLNSLIEQIITLWDFSEEPRRNSSVPIALEHISRLHSPQVYHNPRWHFSLTIPRDWEQIPETQLKEYFALLQGATKLSSKPKYIAAFQKRSDQYFTYPYFLIQPIDTHGYPSAMLEEYFGSAKGERAMQEGGSKVRQEMKPLVSNSSMNITGIDKDRHIVFATTSSDVIGFGEVKGISAMFIGRTSVVNLHFYALQQDFESCKKQYFDQIIDSFEYDHKYRFPDRATSYYNQGLAYAKLEKYAEAVEAYKKAIQIKPDFAEAHCDLGVAYGKLGRHAEEIAAYKQAIRLSPDNLLARHLLATIYGILGRYSESVEVCKETIRLRPNDATAHRELGMAYKSLDRYGQAIAAYQQAIRLESNDARNHYGLGGAYENSRRYAEAAAAYKEAIRLDGDYAAAHHRLGATYSKLGRHNEAIESFQQAIRIKPDYADAYYDLGVTYADIQRHEKAIAAYQHAVRSNPDHARALYNLGVAYARIGRYKQATAAYKQAIRIEPDDIEAHNNLGIAYGKLGRYAEAVAALKQAIRIEPDYAEAHYNLGLSYTALRRHTEAAAAFKQAIRIKPDYANAHLALGIIYLMVDDRGSALEEHKILKNLDKKLANKLFNLIYP